MVDDGIRDDTINGDSEGAGPRRGWLGRLASGVVAVAALGAFGAILIYAYNQGREEADQGSPVVVKASPGPYKVRPQEPGGMEVPDRDKEVYDRLANTEVKKKVERLLPPPEEPLPAPAAPEPALAAQPAPAATESKTNTTADLPASADPAREEPAASAAATAATSVAEEPPPAVPEQQEQRVVVKAPPAAPPKPAPPAKTAADSPYRVQLAALRSEEAVKRAWERLQSLHRDLLSDLELEVERKDLGAPKGIYYRLQAGPVRDRVAARKLCADLHKRKVGCLVVAR